MKKLSKGIAIAGAAAAAAGLFAAGVKFITDAAFNRDVPKSAKKFSGIVSGGGKPSEFKETRDAAAQKLESRSHTIEEIIGRDGARLSGHFFQCENAERIVIAFHGWRSSWSRDFGIASEFFGKSGCNVLYVEQRGQNGSEGEYLGFGLLERFDCVDWVQWIFDRFGSEIPLYLTGVSMGAATVLMASDSVFSRRVNGIIADCGYTSPKAICKHVSDKNLHVPYFIHGAAVDFAVKRKISAGLDDYSAPAALEKTKIPVLFIHGSDDKFVPVEMTYENYKACASEKRLVIIPGADHAMSWYTESETCQRAVSEFWNNFD